MGATSRALPGSKPPLDPPPHPSAGLDKGPSVKVRRADLDAMGATGRALTKEIQKHFQGCTPWDRTPQLTRHTEGGAYATVPGRRLKPQ